MIVCISAAHCHFDYLSTQYHYLHFICTFYLTSPMAKRGYNVCDNQPLSPLQYCYIGIWVRFYNNSPKLDFFL